MMCVWVLGEEGIKSAPFAFLFDMSLPSYLLPASPLPRVEGDDQTSRLGVDKPIAHLAACFCMAYEVRITFTF